MEYMDVGMGLRLNKQMVVDDLEDEFDVISFHQTRSEQKLQGAHIYYGQEELDSAFVYVASAAGFDAHPITRSEICRVSVGTPRRTHDGDLGALIEISAEARWEDVFNAVQATFSRYFAWVQRLFHILNGGGGLHELCVAAIDFFQNPVYIHDDRFNVLAMPMWVVGMSNTIVDETSGNVTFPLAKIQGFENNPAYISTLSTRGTQLWQPDYLRHRTLYINIWSKQHKYCGRFLVLELNASLKPSHFAMVEYFSKFLVTAFERNLFKSGSALSFKLMLQKIFLGEQVEEPYLLDRLRMAGWKRRHRYICFKIQLEKAKNTLLSSHKISSTMGAILKDSYSFPQEEAVCTVCNLTLSAYRETDYWEKMEEACRTLEVKIGVSDPFQDFIWLREFYRQAAKALELGIRHTPERKYYPFHDFALDYIIHHFAEEFNIQTICSGAILQLAAMAPEKGTDYIKTLKCYFDNDCQQTATAQVMYIHRSTLSCRLEGIHAITGVDFSDPDARLFLQISMKLLAGHPPQMPPAKQG